MCPFIGFVFPQGQQVSSLIKMTQIRDDGNVFVKGMRHNWLEKLAGVTWVEGSPLNKTFLTRI
jgi:hypothetical protein